MDKPRIFLGSSGKQQKLLQALTRGLEDVAHVEPWTTSFNPGTTTLERLLELTHEIDFAAFVFARDDWTTNSPPASDSTASGQGSPRDNVVFEAGLSVESSECVELSFSMRAAQSFQATSSVSRAYAMAKRPR
jgi:predicted nucleotide-binding protein